MKTKINNQIQSKSLSVAFITINLISLRLLLFSVATIKPPSRNLAYNGIFVELRKCIKINWNCFSHSQLKSLRRLLREERESKANIVRSELSIITKEF